MIFGANIFLDIEQTITIIMKRTYPKRVLTEAQKQSNRVRANQYYWKNRDIIIKKNKLKREIHKVVTSNATSSISGYENIVYIPIKLNIMTLS
jgi:hypothetical protein